MAWPPPVLPTNRTDATPQQVTHPADHNAANLAINDLVVKVQALDALSLAGRPMQRANLTANSGAAGTTPIAVPGLGFTVPATPGPRWAQVTASVLLVKPGPASEACHVAIWKNGTPIATSIMTHNLNSYMEHTLVRVVEVTGGDVFQIAIQANADLCNVVASPDNPSEIALIDLGPK